MHQASNAGDSARQAAEALSRKMEGLRAELKEERAAVQGLVQEKCE